MMKYLFLGLFLASSLASYAQRDSSKIAAVGIDFSKTVPFLFLKNEGFQKPVIIDGLLLVRTSKPNRFYHISAGYANVQQHRETRILQTVNGAFLKFGKEHNEYPDKKGFFGGYAFAVSLINVSSKMLIQSKFFDDYTSPLPKDSGIGLSAELFGGWEFALYKRLRTRLHTRYTIGYSKDVGAPNAFYLPGAGIRAWNKPLVWTGGIGVQLLWYFEK